MNTYELSLGRRLSLLTRSIGILYMIAGAVGSVCLVVGCDILFSLPADEDLSFWNIVCIGAGGGLTFVFARQVGVAFVLWPKLIAATKRTGLTYEQLNLTYGYVNDRVFDQLLIKGTREDFEDIVRDARIRDARILQAKTECQMRVQAGDNRRNSKPYSLDEQVRQSRATLAATVGKELNWRFKSCIPIQQGEHIKPLPPDKLPPRGLRETI